jgi:hypothetical protein
MGQIKQTLGILLVMLLSACVSAPPLEQVKATQLCSHQSCQAISPERSQQAIGSLKKLFYDGLSREFTLCESSGPGQGCSSNDLGMFVLGGPIPGRGALKSASLLTVTDAPTQNALQLRIALRESFIGTPLICSHADGSLTLDAQGRAILEFAPHYCNWALVGNVFTSFSMVLDRVDLTSRLVSGYYSLATTGTGNGKGSGYAAFRIPDNRLSLDTLVELDELLKKQQAQHHNHAVAPAPAPDEYAGKPRVALVIGNAAYREAPLNNTLNDANAMTRILKSLGFEVTTLLDARYDLMDAGVQAFMEKARTSSIALVYYAGHGIEINGRNYLVGTDIAMSTAASVLARSIDTTEMLAALGQATKGSKVLILDACRDNPFPERYRRQAQGLAQIEAPVDTLIAFSTSPGKVAEDGKGSNSPYTQALVARLEKPNRSLEAVFRDVRKSVVSETHGRQTPWENTSLTREIRLDNSNPVPTP